MVTVKVFLAPTACTSKCFWCYVRNWCLRGVLRALVRLRVSMRLHPFFVSIKGCIHVCLIQVFDKCQVSDKFKLFLTQ